MNLSFYAAKRNNYPHISMVADDETKQYLGDINPLEVNYFVLKINNQMELYMDINAIAQKLQAIFASCTYKSGKNYKITCTYYNKCTEYWKNVELHPCCSLNFFINHKGFHQKSFTVNDYCHPQLFQLYMQLSEYIVKWSGVNIITPANYKTLLN